MRDGTCKSVRNFLSRICFGVIGVWVSGCGTGLCIETPECGTVYQLLVQGQPDFSTNLAARLGTRGVSSIFHDGTRLYSSEVFSRINVWTGAPSTNQAPDYVIGQPGTDQTGSWVGRWTSASSINNTSFVASDGTRLAVSDADNHRVLLWSSIPTQSGTPADIVLGQPTFTATSANAGGVVAANTLSSPNGIAFVGTRLVVADTGNNRLLVWNTFPTGNQQPADVVIGQSAMNTGTCNDGGLDATAVCAPWGIGSDGTRLVVADTNNHRVLLFSAVPAVSNAPADVVLGQSSMATNTTNQGGLSLASLSSPRGARIFGTRVVVADSANHRVLIWTSIPVANGTTAALVLGQASGATNTSNLGGLSAASLSDPSDAAIVGTRLYVADLGNRRLLGWSSIPSSDGVAANLLWRQPDFASSTSLNHGQPAQFLNVPQSGHVCGERLVVSDNDNNRVLVWQKIPHKSAVPADLVIGQPSLDAVSINAGGAVSARTLARPTGVWCDANRLVVSDLANFRVLIWNTFPTSNFQPADIVLGQVDMNTAAFNLSWPAASSYALPDAITSDGTNLVISDYHNNRVMIYRTFPTANNAPADTVIGQPNKLTNAPNNGGITASSLSTPRAVRLEGQKLFVVDERNHRVLIWNSVPQSDGAPADTVLCQPNFTTGTSGLSSSSCNEPSGVAIRKNRLFVSEFGNNRVLIWNRIPNTNGSEADSVIFQSDFSSNRPGLSRSEVAGAQAIFGGPNHLFVLDYLNARVLMVPW